LQQLEMILHLLLGERILFPVHAFGDREDHEEDDGE
jgi:hypothetical protein